MNTRTTRYSAQRTLMFAVLIPMFLVLFLVEGCKEETTPVDPGNPELVTTMTVSLNTSGANTYVYEDLDGTGGAAGTRADTMRLTMGRVYSANIKLENRSVTPNTDLTTDIKAQGVRHKFQFSSTNSACSAGATDQDSLGRNIGFIFTLAPSAVTTGTLTISLLRYADSTAKRTGTPAPVSQIVATYPVIVTP